MGASLHVVPAAAGSARCGDMTIALELLPRFKIKSSADGRHIVSAKAGIRESLVRKIAN
jgi:hypothetical protein